MSETNLLPPIHPGEILFEEFLEPLRISQHRLAKDIGVPPRRINEIAPGKRSINWLGPVQLLSNCASRPSSSTRSRMATGAARWRRSLASSHSLA